ncbi:triose-phosphate isomerase [Robertkochia flava]|uniref:triose-phosphate isomerase n=1 Tax=Robertkochia flava TaxID=3447986 RepID=UPI001CCB58AA|nr:triose-phosphate isomerase [Robertkochia marina]
MRRKIVAGNWKMNMDLAQTESLIDELTRNMPETVADVMIAPTFTSLYRAFQLLRTHKIEVIGQNMHYEDNGAFTGEISAGMLKSVGVNTVILGHSERRAYFGETDEMLAKKVDTAMKHEMEIVFCFGEELEDRKSGNHFQVVESQLKNALFHFPESAWKNIILAYEPVWAIGTGETASPEQAQEMHKFIRETLAAAYSEELANGISILYGGSVKPGNAGEIFSKPDVDGGLIGGAALKAEDFIAIAKSF